MKKRIGIRAATESYESWLSQLVDVLPADLAAKHQAMSGGVFPFLRATFYRWTQVWPEVCPELATAPDVLSVGDLHVENFGTWRDVEGRLIWGINDFDETFDLPYTSDLVRLAASAHLAIESSKLAIREEDACDAILSGYATCMEGGGTAFVLAEQHEWLRKLATNELRAPRPYWEKLKSFPLAGPMPGRVRRELERLLPERGLEYQVVHRIAGLGSLGRPRFVALAEWKGGLVAREAKALAPSACFWARGKGSDECRSNELLDSAVRCPDPCARERRNWMYRRLAPDCTRVELSSLVRDKDASRLLHAMGWETANIHLGSRRAAERISKDLRERKKRWLHSGALAMLAALRTDWEEWKGSMGEPIRT